MRMPHGLAPTGREPDRIVAGEEDWVGVSPARWARLWEAVARAPESHALDPGALGEYALLLHRHGEAPAAEAFPEVAAHLAAGCARCGADLEELLAFAAEEADPPPSAAPGRLFDPADEGLRRLIAARITPRRERRAMAVGARGAPGPGRDVPTVVYQTDEATVVLRVNGAARADTVSVRGLILPHRRDSAALWGGEARLLDLAGPRPGGGGVYLEHIDERGGFVLEDVAPGAYRLELRSAHDVVVLNDLEIGCGQGLGSPRP
jgi:hypothetical protein